MRLVLYLQSKRNHGSRVNAIGCERDQLGSHLVGLHHGADRGSASLLRVSKGDLGVCARQ
jgi:hypothetical protein